MIAIITHPYRYCHIIFSHIPRIRIHGAHIKLKNECQQMYCRGGPLKTLYPERCITRRTKRSHTDFLHYLPITNTKSDKPSIIIIIIRYHGSL